MCPRGRAPFLLADARRVRKNESGNRRDDDVEGVFRASAERRRIGERTDDLRELDERARPAVRDEERQRPRLLRSPVDEMNVQAIYSRRELLEGTEEPFLFAPVESIAPVVDQLPEAANVGAVGPAVALERNGKPCPGETSLQIGEGGVRHANGEQTDRSGSTGWERTSARSSKTRTTTRNAQKGNALRRAARTRFTPLRSSRRTRDVLHVLIVLLTDVFHQLFVRTEAGGERHRKRSGVRAWIVDRHFVLQMSEVGARVAFDGVQLFRVRMAAEIEPELVVEADCVDHQCVALPATDGMSVPRGVGIVGMFAAVDEDLAIAVDVPFEQEEDVRRGWYD